MKFFLAMLVAMVYNISIKAADISVKAQIKEVTVYTSGAQVKATADASLTKGTYNLVIENVSQFIDDNSFQIKGAADFTILSIVVKKDFLNENYKDPIFKKLEDSLEIMRNKVATCQSYISALTDEQTMIKTNQKIGGSNANLTSVELEKMATFIRSRAEEIYNKLNEQNNAKAKLQLRVNDLQNQINTYNAENNKNKADVVVAIKSNAVGKADLELSYNVSEAGWSPFYDIRSDNVSAPVVITSKAKVWQNTGENWNNVKLFISTGSPSVSLNIPAMNPYYVNLQSETYRIPSAYNLKTKGSRAQYDSDMAMPATESGALANTMQAVTSSNSSNYTINTESQTNNIFEITIPYTIKSDGSENVVGIQKYEVPAKYNYTAKPKLDCAAFLEAKLTGWNQSGLLPGDANVFFEGAFIGKTYFETSVANDTISISFGRDNNILVERKQKRIFNDKNFVSGNKAVSLEYEIVVKNKKKNSIEISVEDQIPLTSNSNVEVELSNDGKAEYTKETGSLKWSATIKSAENIVYNFGYKVRYPKGYKITNLN